MRRAVLLSSWVATAAVAFAIGWVAASQQTRGEPAPGEMGTAVRAALGEGGHLDRLGRLIGLLEHLDPEQLPEVLTVYERMLASLEECEIRPFVEAWTRFDGLAALERTRGWELSGKRMIGVEAAIRGWALRNLPAARLAAEQIGAEDPALTKKLRDGLVSGWVHSGTPGLGDYLAAMPNGFSRDAVLAVAVRAHVRKRGTDGTLHWAEEVISDAEPTFQKALFRRATHAVARQDPERAAAWAKRHAEQEYAQDGPRLVARHWAEHDGPAAIEWARSQPKAELRDEAARAAFSRWLTRRPEEAEKWLQSASLTAFHDPALDVYASQLVNRSPAEAVAWAERIRDEDRRRRALKRAATSWYRKDAVAAEAWLQQSPLDEEARREVRQPAPRRRRGAPRVQEAADTPS